MRRTAVPVLLALAAAVALLWSWSVIEGRSVSLRDGRAHVQSAAQAPKALAPEAPLPPSYEPRPKAQLESTEAARSARDVGVAAAPPETLVALCGRVLDGETGKPVPRLRLSFLSSRPRNVEVVTGEDGAFTTEVALAPGLVSVMHLPDGDDPRYQARWDIDPPQFLLPRPEPGKGTCSIDLRGDSPNEVLEVDVVMPEGDPAAGASVTMTGGRKDGQGAFHVEVRDLETADLQGRARFALFGGDVFQRIYLVEAEHLGAFSSDLMVIDGPFGPRARRLDLFPAGVLTVRVRNEEGRPLSNVSLFVSTDEGGQVVRGRNAQTDAQGEAIIAPLRAACWTVSATHPLTGRTLSRTLDLPRGASKEVEFTLGVGGLRLAVSGTVVDEFGYPLPGVTVHAQSGDEAPVALVTGDNGVYAFWAKQAERVLLSVGGGYGDDIYDPAMSELPFGTSALTVVRRARLESRSLPFIVVDARSGKTVRKASIVLHHPAADFTVGGTAMMRFGAASGVTTVGWKERDDLRYAVEAPGYLRSEGRMVDLLEECSQWGPLRVDLAQGFERDLVVVDRVTGRPVAKAVVRDGSREVGSTDSSGRIQLRANDWPDALRIDAGGYRALLWNPAEAEFPGTRVQLDPVRAVDEQR